LRKLFLDNCITPYFLLNSNTRGIPFLLMILHGMLHQIRAARGGRRVAMSSMDTLNSATTTLRLDTLTRHCACKR
jgi:hypothetical protein